MANVLASVANYEIEVRSERQRAGIAAAKQRVGTVRTAARWKTAQVARAWGWRV
jgi:DNA invertase Pin-like site-specific DNA recombinase